MYLATCLLYRKNFLGIRNKVFWSLNLIVEPFWSTSLPSADEIKAGRKELPQMFRVASVSFLASWSLVFCSSPQAHRASKLLGIEHSKGQMERCTRTEATMVSNCLKGGGTHSSTSTWVPEKEVGILFGKLGDILKNRGMLTFYCFTPFLVCSIPKLGTH